MHEVRQVINCVRSEVRNKGLESGVEEVPASLGLESNYGSLSLRTEMWLKKSFLTVQVHRAFSRGLDYLVES